MKSEEAENKMEKMHKQQITAMDSYKDKKKKVRIVFSTQSDNHHT